MASVKDALDDSIQGHISIIKFIIFAIPLFIVISYKNITGYIFWLSFTVILLLGFMLQCSYNVRMGNMKVLPSYNIFSILYTGICGIIALAPISLISYFASKYIIEYASNYIAVAGVLKAIEFIVYFIFGSFILTSYLLFANKFKIFDAFKINLVYKYCIDILLAVAFMIVQIVIVDVIIVAPVTYIIWLFVGIPHPISIFFWCVVGVLNLAMVGHYMAQISYEIIEVKESDGGK